jgi:hypothetical protein
MIEYTDEYVLTLHPRQQRALMPVPQEARKAVTWRANLIMNTRPGYIYSQAISRAAADLVALGGDLDALEALDQRESRAASASCRCGAVGCG